MNNSDVVYCLYTSCPERRQRVIDGWRQFAKDLENHKLQAKALPVIADVKNTLPTIFAVIDGRVSIQTNIMEAAPTLDAYLKAVNEIPLLESGEQDFEGHYENLKLACKHLAEFEKLLKANGDQVTSQLADLAAFQSEVARLMDTSKKARLHFEKVVKTDKENRKKNIVNNAQAELNKHLAFLIENLGGATLPPFKADFGGAIKGKSSLAAMRDAVDAVLANAKAETIRLAGQIRANQDTFKGYESQSFLFPDINALLQKQPDDFIATLDARVARHHADTKAQAEEDAQRGRQEKERPDGEKQPENHIADTEISAEQAIALINTLVAVGIKQTKHYRDAISMLNLGSPDGLEGFRIAAALCVRTGELAALLNDMRPEQKTAMRPRLQAIQDRIKRVDGHGDA